MTFSDETYEKIDRYLDRQMSPDEINDFEQELQANQELAAEVQLHADMKTSLADTPENQLRQNLQQLSDDFPDDEKPVSHFPKGWLWLLLPLLLLGAYWLMPQNMTKDTQDIQEETPPPPNSEQTRKAPPKEEPAPPSVPETTAPKEEKTTPPSQTKVEEPQPIAANFTPNPSLEFLIDNNMRDGEFEWVSTDFVPLFNRTGAQQTVPFSFSAQLKTQQNLLEKAFKLHLFNNKAEAFDNFEPLHSFDLTWSTTEENIYQTELQQPLDLPWGLYYFMVEEVELEKVYLVEKFEVRPAK